MATNNKTLDFFTFRLSLFACNHVRISTKSLLNLDCLRAGLHELIVRLGSSAIILGTEYRGRENIEDEQGGHQYRLKSIEFLEWIPAEHRKLRGDMSIYKRFFVYG